MSDNVLYSIAPYSGDLSRIDKFYRLLGIHSENGIVKNKGFEIIYGRESLNVSDFQLVVEVKQDLSDMEKTLKNEGFNVTESGYDGAGPFLLVEDPSGMIVRIGVS